MADNIKGIFFGNQVLTAKGLGSMAKSALSDGILSGCGISLSGNNLTINPGFIVVCGRVIEITAATTKTIPSGSAYVSLYVSIDLSQGRDDAMKLDFKIATGIASALAFTETDINLDDNTYQSWIALIDCSGSTPAILEIRHSQAKAITKLWHRDISGMSSDTFLELPLRQYDAILICSSRTSEDRFAISTIVPYNKNANQQVTFSITESWIGDPGEVRTVHRTGYVNPFGFSGHPKATVKFNGSWYVYKNYYSTEAGNSAAIPYDIYGLNGVSLI